ncbi:hypothetical protein [Ilumatobacter sp.]|uniref:hypothetical protein n=1 Tax=Ilumatobacter sp. TaxID=1967498 RepID=UPI003B5233AB
MKLLPKSPQDVRVNTDDSLGHGMDAVIVLCLFVGGGWLLDRAFGTLPLLMIVMTVLGSVGLFARFYYSYAGRMDRHDADRRARAADVAARRAGPLAAPSPTPAPSDTGDHRGRPGGGVA